MKHFNKVTEIQLLTKLSISCGTAKSTDHHTGHYFPHRILKWYTFIGSTMHDQINCVCFTDAQFFLNIIQVSKGCYGSNYLSDFRNKWLIFCFNYDVNNDSALSHYRLNLKSWSDLLISMSH